MKEIKIDLIKLQKARGKPGCLQGHSFGLHEEWSRVRRLGKKIGVNKKPPGIPRAKHETATAGFVFSNAVLNLLSYINAQQIYSLLHLL